MKSLVALLIVWLVLIILVVVGVFLYIPYSQDEGMKETLTGIGIGITAVGSLMTGLITFLISKRSIQAAKDLEATKKVILEDIEKKRRDYAEDLARLNSNLQKDLQTLKQNFDRQTEIMKATTLSREIEAYEEVFAAAAQYYSSLSKLENGEWSKADYGPCEERMAKARSKVPYLVSVQHRTAWETIWTKAALIARSALATPDDQRKALWLANVAEFGTKLKEFQAIVTEKFPRP